MATRGLTARRVTAFLDNVAALASTLPTEDQKAEVERELDTIIGFLTNVREALAKVPTRVEGEGLEQSLKVLRHFVEVAEADPLISKTLGLQGKASRSRMVRGSPRVAVDVKAAVDELRSLSPEEVRRTLEGRMAKCTLMDLREIAAELGVRARSKASRAIMVDHIVKRLENQAGYEYLREHA